MKKKKAYGIFALCMLAVCSFGGCQRGKLEETDAITEQDTGHVETELTLPDGGGNIIALNQLSDGSLKGVGSEGTFLTSNDGGESWEAEPINLVSGKGAAGDIEMACVSDEGSAFFTVGIHSNETEEQDGHQHPHEYYYADGAGEVTQLTLDFPQEEGVLALGTFLTETEVAAWYQGDSSIYKISMESGACEKLFEAAQGYQGFCYTGEEIIADAGNSLLVYDMELGTTKVLSAQGVSGRKLSGGAGAGRFYQMNSQGIFLCSAEDGKGELVVSGNTNSMGNPSLDAIYFLPLEDGEFIAAFRKEDASYQVVKYGSGKAEETNNEVQSEEASEKEEKQQEAASGKELTIYTLYDSELLRLAIDAFQKEHTQTEVSLEIGVTGEDAVTPSDAIKNLNTELVSGEGPDLIFMDEIPMEDYIEKGVLEDVSAVLETYDGQLYENIVRTYEREGKIYALPTRFAFPVLLSEGKALENAGSLAQVADAVEQYANQEEEGHVISPITSRQVVESFYDAYSTGFYTEDGEISQENIAAFLEQASRIYEVRRPRTSSEELSRGQALDEEYMEDEFSGPYTGVGAWLAGEIKLSVQHIYDMNSYGTLTSLAKANGAISIQSIGNAYLPMQVAGISAKSENKEGAMEFLELLLSKEMQENSSYRNLTGFPVNREALEAFGRTEQQENGASMGERYFPVEAMLTGEEPDPSEEQMLEFYWPSDEDYHRLEEIIENLTVPYRANEELKAAVLEQGSRCLEGEISAEDAAEAVVQEVRLQMLE